MSITAYFGTSRTSLGIMIMVVMAHIVLIVLVVISVLVVLEVVTSMLRLSIHNMAFETVFISFGPPETPTPFNKEK